jgi:hypothetical protein
VQLARIAIPIIAAALGASTVLVAQAVRPTSHEVVYRVRASVASAAGPFTDVSIYVPSGDDVSQFSRLHTPDSAWHNFPPIHWTSGRDPEVRVSVPPEAGPLGQTFCQILIDGKVKDHKVSELGKGSADCWARL